MDETLEEIADRLARALENPNLPGYTALMPIGALRDGILYTLLAQRERDAAIADDFADEQDEEALFSSTVISIARSIAAAIRKQG